ncbi:MAG TPA: alkaline phosphatase family protein [Candidatus Eremiobacteraceae bacterium]|nr:alkaline phosphatase family protein [Candidatus Eremiobacteraceae bacterium]
MRLRLAAAVAAVVFGCALIAPRAVSAAVRPLDRAFVIMMENQGFDNVIGHLDPNNVPDTPYITYLAHTYGLSLLQFGVTHPSLPNYVSLISGDYFGIQDDNPSCYAQPAPPPPCDQISATNLVDELEAKNISWESFNQTMPSAGYLGTQFPVNGAALYAQKHNPFVYFSDIATNPNRLAKIVPLPDMKTLSAALSNSQTAPRFVLVVPDQCHDMHGEPPCANPDLLLQRSDRYVESVIKTIMTSPAYTMNSAIFLTWDENDYSTFERCCDSPAIGGGHIATVVITPRTVTPIASPHGYNEYSILATLERSWGLGLLGHTADVNRVSPMADLLP